MTEWLVRVGLFGVLVGALAAADDVGVRFEKLALTDAEKSKSGSVFTPVIELLGKKWKLNHVMVHPGEGISLAIPETATTNTIKRAFLNVEHGGVYIEDPHHPEAIAAKGPTRYLKLFAEKEAETALQLAERNFIRQLAYLLVQRAPEASETALFLQRYFGVTADEGGERTSRSTLNADLGEIKLGQSLNLGVANGADLGAQEMTLTPTRHFMNSPTEWTAKECNEKSCIYTHPEFGQRLFKHPGVADLVVTEEEITAATVVHEVQSAPEVSSRPELEGLLAQTDPSVERAYILLSHEECGPCQQLKNKGGAWERLCERITRGRMKRLAAFAENARTSGYQPSQLMQQYSLPSGYPQLLIFTRQPDGTWSSPERFDLSQIPTKLPNE